MNARPKTPITKRHTLAQVIICALGCCCNRIDKGKPAVPVDRLKKEFRERRLLRHIHLTFAGCLGPCDLSNVAAIVTPQETVWLGGLSEDRQFQEILDWAIKSSELERLLPLPESLAKHRFERWRETLPVDECDCCESVRNPKPSPAIVNVRDPDQRQNFR